MGFDGFLVPDWAKPYVGWAVGMDWPEGDEARCFRLADACAATARSVAGEGPLSSQGSLGAAGGAKWDGEALKLFAEHVKRFSGGRQAELVDRLVSAALELNQAGVQVEYTKKMIEVSVWFLIFQIGWLLAASAGPWGTLSLALIGPRVQLARMTIRQIRNRLLTNLALFGGLGVGMDVGVQLSQSRRDGIDWESVKASGMMGALSGVFLTALPAGLSGLSTAGLRAGLSRAEMTAFEKFLAASTGSMWGMMAQSGLANGAATAISLAMSGQFDWEMVLKGTTAGVIGGADAHWAGQPTVRGAGGDGGGPAHGGDGGGPAGGPAGGSPAGGTVPHDPGGPSGPGGKAPHGPGGPLDPGGTVPRDPGGPSGPGAAVHQAGSGRPADQVTASGGTGHAPADSATVLAQAVPPAVLGPDGTAPPHTAPQAVPPAVPPAVLRADGTAPPHAAPLADAAAPARVPSHAEAAAPASAPRNGGGPAVSAVRTENPGPGAAAGRAESAGPASAVTRTEGGSPAHPAAGPGRAHVTADGPARPGPNGTAHSGPGTAAHPGPDAARPGSGDAAHSGAGGAARPGSGPEVAVPAPRDPVATGESVPATRPEAGSIDSLINHGDGQGTATVLTEQQNPPAPQPLPAAGPDTVRPPRPITLRDHESFAQSVATGITGPREPLRTGTESLRADRVTLGDGTRAVDKELAGRDARDREYLTSRLGQAVGADVAAVHIAGERRVLVDWVGGERAEVRLNPDGSWEAPGHRGTADGILLGLLDTLTSHYDRFRFPDADLDLRAADIDLRVGENGALRAFDHEKAFQGILPDTRNPFVRHFFRETSPMRVEWAGNPLSRRDIEVLRARIDALEGEFRALGRDDWYANAKFAFDRIAEHAEGTTSLLDAAREPAGARSGRTPGHAGGLDGGAPRNADGALRSAGEAPRSVEPASGKPEPAARTAPPARTEPSSGRPDPVGTARPARDAVPAGEDAASSGGARDRASEGGTRDAASADGARGVTSRDGTPSPDEAAVRLMDPGGELGRSVAGGVRHSRLLDADGMRAEIVTFGDGRTAMRLTGRDAEAVEAAALTRVALGLDGPAVHRSGDVVYREYGDDALRRSIETGVRETRLIPNRKGELQELVTFNDGRRAFRVEYKTVSEADAVEVGALPPRSVAEASKGIHRASETVVYRTRVRGTNDPDMKPLVRSESPGHAAKRGVYDVLTLGETFTAHVMDTNAHGDTVLGVERSFADIWDKALLDDFLIRDIYSQSNIVDFKLLLNRLTGEDVAAVAARLEALRPEFERRGWQHWHDGMTERFEHLGRQARGDQPLLTGPDAVPHGPVPPEATPHDGAAVPAARSADAKWPYDYTTTWPDEALARVLRDGNLGWLNEVLADPAAHPEDVARVRAYAALADEGLADLPRSRGTVQARVPLDRLPEGLVAGREFTARGFLEGVDDPRFLPDMPHSARLVVYGEHTRVGDLSGKPHQVLFEEGARFKVLGVHETSYGVKEYFLARVSDVEGVLPDTRTGELRKAPPELTGRLQEHFDEHRETTKAGVWYRDLSDPEDLDLADSARAVRKMDGLFYVDAHGNPDGVYIGSDKLSPRELATLLLNEPGLRPDDVIYLGNCSVGQESYAQKLARETGHVVVAADSAMTVNEHGDMSPITGSRRTMADRGQLLVFLPDAPVPPMAWERVRPGLVGQPFFSDGPGAHGGLQSGFRTAEPTGRAEPVTRAEPTGRPDPVDTARPVRDAGEDATPSGETRVRASDGEMRNRASEGEGWDAASADEVRGAPSPGEAAARLMDPGGELGRSVAGGVRHSRILDADGMRAEIVTFGDGRTAMRLTGRDAEAAEAAALTRAALGLDGPAVHRSGDVVYREHGDDALRRSIETGVRETRLIPVRNGFWELVTFNDGGRAFRVDHKTIAAADDAEVVALPHRSAAEVNRGLHRASETVVYHTQVKTTDPPVVTGDPEVKPLVRDESYGHAVKRAVYDVLTLGETFTAHVMDTNAYGDTVLGVERGFADKWDKTLLDHLLALDDYSQSDIEYYRFRRNGLADEDAAAMAARLEALWPEFERRGWQHWHDGMVERLELIGWHTEGEKAVLTGPDAVPHGPVLPDMVPHDGAGSSAAHDGAAAPAAAVRPADAGWPHDPAGVRPDEALARVLREGGLGRLNEVLADPAAHPDDVARARAYAKLVGAGLAELPRERGTVQVRVPVDRLPEGLAAGQKFTARGFLEGVDDPRFLPDMDHSARLVVYGEHTHVGDLSGRPHQVVFGENSRFKVLGVHETSYGVKEYFVARVSDVEGVLPSARRHWFPKAPPELPPLLRWHFDEHRETTKAGVWYRDLSEPGDEGLADSARAVRKMDGLFYVDAHGSSDGVYIGEDKLGVQELAALLFNEPGLRPDDVIYLGNCKVGQEAFAQELARETGHVVIAADSMMNVNEFGDMGPLTDGRARDTMTGRGRLLIFLPDAPTPVLTWRRIRSWITDPPFFSDGPGEHGGSQPGIRAAEPAGRVDPARSTPSDTTSSARTEPSSGRPGSVGEVPRARDAVPAGEDAAPSGGARDRASESGPRDRAFAGETRDRTSSEGGARDRGSEARDAVPAGGARDRTPAGEGAAPQDAVPSGWSASPGEAVARLLDPGGELGRSAAGGVRHVRFLDDGGTRTEIVTFGDGRTAMRLTGRDAETAEAAALTRAALGLDGPAVHRSGDVVYRQYGDDALRRSIETGIRDSRMVLIGSGEFMEIVTFNDGVQANRLDCGNIAQADRVEASVLPPRTVADPTGNLHRGSETVLYQRHIPWADVAELQSLVWDESYGHAVKRAVYDVLTLGETFAAHKLTTNAHGERHITVDRDFGDRWHKPLLEDLLGRRPSRGYVADFVFRRNELNVTDIMDMAARLEALRPEFERLGWRNWHDGMVERLYGLGQQARGRESLLTGPDAVPHGPVLPDAVPRDGAVAPAARPADAAWPRDPAGMRPRQALVELLWEGDLRRLNEVLADPAARPDDVARARAYAELVGEALVELPRSQGTVQVRVPADRLPEGLAAGREFTARGILEGVDDPRFLPDMPHSVRLIIHGDHARVADLSGRPGHVMIEGDARFKVLGVYETSYGVREYFVMRITEDAEGGTAVTHQDVRPKERPELPERLRRHVGTNREVTDAGVWYREPAETQNSRFTEGARAVRKMDGVFYVDGHGDSRGLAIGREHVPAGDLAMLLLNEPGLRPDDVIFLGNCEVGAERYAQEVANRTGHVVVAADSLVHVRARTGDVSALRRDHELATLAGRGRLLIFLPEDPVPPGAWERVRSWTTDPSSLPDGTEAHGGPQPGTGAAEAAGHAGLTRSTPADGAPPARAESPSGHGDPVGEAPRARDTVPAGENATPLGGTRDAGLADEVRGVTSRDGTPSPDEAAARLLDPGGELGRSAAGGVRHSRSLDVGGVRAEIVTFGDGRTAMRLTGRDAEAAEAAALTRAALGLDGPAVHRSGDVVYREYGDDALRRSIETGVREARVINTGSGRSVEIVTFNDGVQARRVDCGSIARADRVEASVLPPRTVADPNGGLHRASETVIYRSHLSQTDVAELRPLVRDESHGHAAKRGLYDVLTLGETFDPHRAGTNASGELLIGVDRDFAGRWGKPALDGFLHRPTSAAPGDFVFRHNGLYWTDVVAVHARLEELRPEFERRGWQRWHDDMVERLELLGRHAGGEKALLTGPDAVPHGPVLPDAVPRDGAVAPAARPADAAWPRDPAGMRPRQALVELLWEGDLRRLNEVLADPAARPDDVARARAYAELVGEALVELPRSQGTVQVRVPADRLPEGLAAGREFTARGILEGVDDPRFLPDMPHSVRLIIHGDHARVADLSGRPGHVMIEGDARFKVLGIHETSYGVKEYFVMRITEDAEGGTAVPRQDVRPKERPEVPDRLRRHITTNREVTNAGVWYRTPEEALKTAFAASARAVRKMDGVFYVDGHGNPRGLFIGGEHIPAADLAAMLLNEPGLRPDDVIYLGNCKVGAERYAQEVANRTGHVVAASETLMHVSDKSGDMVALRPDHRPGTLAGRGRLLIFLPEGPVPPAAWERVRSMAEAPPPLSPDGPGGPGGLDGTRPGPGGEHGDPLIRSADEHGAPRHRPGEARETPGVDSSGTPDPSHSPDTPAVPVRDDGLAASVAGGVRATRVVERGGTRLEIVTFEDGRQAIRLTGRDADAAEMAALVRGAMGMDGPATHRAGDVVYRDYGNEALRRSLATGIRRSESFENAQGRMEELVTFNDGRQAVRTEYARATDADGHELTGLPPRFTGAADSGILRAGETVVYSEHRVSPGDPRPEGAAWHESPAEQTRRGMYTVLTMGDGFARHEVTVDAHGVHHLRVGEELPARWGGPAIREFLVAHRSSEGEPSQITFRQNRLSPEDAAAVSARLEALRPEFARRGRLDWHDGLMDRLGHLARHADGEHPVLEGLDGHAGTGERPVPGDPDGHAETGRTGERPVPGRPDGRTGTGADGGTGGHAPEVGDWRSRDPRAALSELLTHGDLPEVHDALAGRTGDPGDAARAGAYLDLANAELAGLPHRTGQVGVRVPADWLPGDLAPGREVVFRGLLEGVDDPRFLADAPGSVRLTIRGRYANVGDISGKPHHAMFDANARFKVLAVQESSSGAKNYFLAQVGEAADAPAAHAGGVPRPELTGEALRHFTEHREETRAGVWYRDPDSSHDMANAMASRGALPVDGAFTVSAHGDPEGVYIGGRLLPVEEFVALLLNEPRLHADDVLLLADCELGHPMSSYAQEVADRTGRVVLAPDAFYGVTEYGDGLVGSIQEAPHSLLGRGWLRIFLPEGPMPLTTWEKVQAWVASGRPAHPGSPGHDRVPAALPDGHGPGAATRDLPHEAPGPGREVAGDDIAGDDIAYFGRDDTGSEHGASASESETGSRVPDGSAVHHAGEHGEPVSYTRDTEAFERVYDDAATRFAEGEPVDAIVPYMTENATDGVGAPGSGRGFGVELEFALPRIPWKDWPPVVESIARELYEAGLAEDSVVYDYHDSGKGYDRGWRLELEADSGIAGEVISPILYDDPASWRDLERVAEIIRSHGGEATALTGGHVHVGIPDYGTSVAKHVRLLKIYHAFEDVLFRIAQNPVDELGLHRGYDNCLPNADPSQYRTSFDNIRLYNLGVSAVSMTDARGLPSDHLEFRMWDGHVDPGIIQARIKLSLALAELASRELDDIPPPERLGHHEERLRSGERISREEETASFRALADLVFSRTADKEQLTALFALNRWQPTLERYMELMED